jgi:hypothetical protein
MGVVMCCKGRVIMHVQGVNLCSAREGDHTLSDEWVMSYAVRQRVIMVKSTQVDKNYTLRMAHASERHCLNMFPSHSSAFKKI